MRHHAVLIHGYLGFAGTGERFQYWGAVEPLLAQRGIVCHVAQTEPSATLEQRAERLKTAIVETFDAPPYALHLIGHSMGGLDARHLMSPATEPSLPNQLRGRVRSVTTLATPHRGAPLADFCHRWRLEDLLALAAKLAARWSTQERVEWFARFLSDRRDIIAQRFGGAAEEISRIIQDIAEAPDEQLPVAQRYLRSLATHRGALKQLRVREMAQRTVAMTDAPGVRYFSYVAGVRPESPTALFALMSFVSSRRVNNSAPKWESGGELDGDLVIWPRGGRVRLEPDLTDGLVPSVSQLYGETRGYASVDHHAIIGRYDLAGDCGFKEDGIGRLYARIADDLLATG